MIELCKNNNFFIVNGRLGNDNLKFTCKDRSCVDYYVSTAYVFDLVYNFSIEHFEPWFSDSHCPISMYLKCRNKGTKKPEQSYCETESEIRLWNDDKGDKFGQNLNMQKINEILSNLSDMTAKKNEISESSINEAVSSIGNLFLDGAKNVFGVKKKKKNENKNKPWFNFNCKMARNEYHRVRKLYNRNKTQENKNNLNIVSKSYKTVMKQSISRFKTERILKLKNLKNAKPKEYWKIINS